MTLYGQSQVTCTQKDSQNTRQPKNHIDIGAPLCHSSLLPPSTAMNDAEPQKRKKKDLDDFETTYGTEVETVFPARFTFYDLSEKLNAPETLCYLLDETTVQLRDSRDRSLLHHCQDPTCFSLLLAHGADANARDINGNTPLHTHRASAEIVKLLLTYGAEVNARNNAGKTPLHLRQSLQSLRLLLAAGANANAADINGETPLFTHGRWPQSAELIAAGADPLAVSHSGVTTLMRAKDARTTELLLQAGVDPNARAADGTTALMTARTAEQTALLLRAGATPIPGT